MPDESTVTEVPRSALVPSPPKFAAHTRSPDESSFDMNTSVPATEVRLVVPGPGSKSAVPQSCPVVYTLPDESTATELL